MAFEQPLEGDRVNDLNLYSVFIRAPVVGPLMWMLSGNTARDKEEAERRLSSMDEKSNLNIDCSIKQDLSTGPALKSTDLRSQKSTVDECREALNRIDLSESVQGPSDAHALRKRKKALSWSDEIGCDLATYMEKEVRCSRVVLFALDVCSIVSSRRFWQKMVVPFFVCYNAISLIPS